MRYFIVVGQLNYKTSISGILYILKGRVFYSGVGSGGFRKLLSSQIDKSA